MHTPLESGKYIPKKTENRDSNICIPMFMATLLTVAKMWGAV